MFPGVPQRGPVRSSSPTMTLRTLPPLNSGGGVQAVALFLPLRAAQGALRGCGLSGDSTPLTTPLVFGLVPLLACLPPPRSNELEGPLPRGSIPSRATRRGPGGCGLPTWAKTHSMTSSDSRMRCKGQAKTPVSRRRWQRPGRRGGSGRRSAPPPCPRHPCQSPPRSCSSARPSWPACTSHSVYRGCANITTTRHQRAHPLGKLALPAPPAR